MKISVFGGSGGLGSKLKEYILHSDIFDDCSFDFLSSKTVNVINYSEVVDYINNISPDVVINAAGINIDNLAHNYTEEDLIKMINVNINGIFNIVKASIPIMRVRSYGRLINFSSVLSTRPIKGTSLYSSCKSFSDTFMKTVAIENAKYGITANTIRLGYFDGGMTYKVPTEILEKVKQKIPCQRFGQIDELASTIRNIITCSYINGNNIELSGGLHI